MPKVPGDLLRHQCINYRFPGTGAVHDWGFTEPGPQGASFHPGSGGKADDQRMTRAALRGLGLMQIVDIAVQAELTDGRLVRA